MPSLTRGEIMAEDKIEEETYSLIFTSLKHPIRRRILRMLADKPFTYSEILETLTIDSGHLSYHLENLGDLTVHSNNGHYRLSSFGLAAVKLMGGVEEQEPSSLHRRFNRWQLFTKIFSVILAFALIGASFHLVTYAIGVSTTTKSTDHLLFPIHTNILINVSIGETFELNVTIAHRPPIYGRGFGVSVGFQQCTFHIPRLENSLTGWDEAKIWIESTFNMTTLLTFYPYQEVPLTILNSTPQTNQTITITGGGWGLGVNPNEATDPSNLEVEVYTPEETILTENFYREITSRFDTSSSPPIPVTRPCTYTFKITNKGSWDWNGFLMVNLEYKHFEKPNFWWGIVGFIIAVGHIVLVTITSHKARNKNEAR